MLRQPAPVVGGLLASICVFACQPDGDHDADSISQTPLAATASDAGVVLNFESLPSAQGWTYVPTLTSASESSIFKVTGSSLIQNSLGIGASAAPHYEFPGVVESGVPFTLSVRARVLQEEIFRENRFGFTIGVTTDTEGFLFGISSLGIQDQRGDFFNPVFDATQFHDFRVEGTPGVGYNFFIDNVLVWSGLPNSLGDPPRSLFFGDESQNNALVEIASFRFQQSPRGYRLPFSGPFPIKSAPTCKKHQHSPEGAVDYSLTAGTPVLASEDGTVESVGLSDVKKVCYGWIVDIRHADGRMTRYAHLTPNSTDALKRGQRVCRGHVIALSGNSTGDKHCRKIRPHLHFEIRRPNGSLDVQTVATLPGTTWLSEAGGLPVCQSGGKDDGAAIGPPAEGGACP